MAEAVVTDAEKNVLKAVNGIPAIAYMETLGLAKDGKLWGASLIPIIVDRRDGSAPSYVVVTETTPEGSIVLSGFAPVDSLLGFASIGRDDVLESASEVVKIIEKDRTDVFLFFSCLMRNIALGLDTLAEVRQTMKIIDDSVPYLFAYSGGEICPLNGRDGRSVNRFHNLTAIACAF
jgi:hypothetical protein